MNLMIGASTVQKGYIVYKEGICFANFTCKDRECEVECDESYPDDLIVDVQVNENNTKEVLVDYKYRVKESKEAEKWQCWNNSNACNVNAYDPSFLVWR